MVYFKKVVMSAVDAEFPVQRRGRTLRLFACSSILASVTFLAACRSPQHYYSAGNDLYNSGKYQEAELNYRKAIQKDPKFGAAVYQLGLTEIKEHRGLDAYNTLGTAVTLLPDDPAPRIHLADLILAGYLAAANRPQVMYNRILELAAEIERIQPKSPDVFRLRGVLAESDKHPAQAVELLRRADALHPGDPDIVSSLVQALIQNGQNAEAEKLALELIQKHKEFGPIYNVLYLLYLATNRSNEAQNILLDKVRNNPRELQPVLELANHYRNVGKPQLADAALNGALADAKTFPDAPREVGNFYLERGLADNALSAFQTGLKGSTGEQHLLFQKRMVRAYLVKGQRVQAMSLLDELVRQYPKDDDSKNMQASLRIDSGKPDEVASALAQMEDLVKRVPNDPSYHYNLGRAEYLSGKLDDAKRDFAEQLRLDPSVRSVPARYFLASIDIRRELYPSAIAQTDELLARNASDVRARLLKVEALTGTKNYQQAHIVLNALLRDQPRLPEAELELGYLDVAEKKFNEADEIFRQLYHPGQQDTRALSGLVDVDVARNQTDRAVQLLSEELKRNPEATTVRSALARLYYQSGRLDLALAEYRQLTSLNPKEPDFQMGTGSVLQAKGDFQGAIAAYRRASELAPKSYVPPGVLGSTLQFLGRKEEAVVAYRDSLRLRPDDAPVSNNLAFLLADMGKNLDEALELAQKAEKEDPSQPQYQDTLGWVYLKKGEAASALQIFQNLSRKSPENTTFGYHLGMALLEKGDSKGAIVALETALRGQPSQGEEAEIKALLARINNVSAAQPRN
jgi:tetratricopeptide (TPR) repeat protein